MCILNEVYKKDVEFFADERIENTFPNSSREHAKVVLHHIFRTAEKEVNVYCGNMCSEIHSDLSVKNMISSFLKRGGMMRIMLSDADSKCAQSMVESIDGYSFNNVKIRSIDNQIKSDHPFFENNHFTVADERMYRHETNIKTFEGICSFNDVIKSQKLLKLFDFAYKKSESKVI